MTRLDPEAIAQKLSRMVDRIDRLKLFEGLPLEEYLQDDLKQAAIERLLEAIIDAALSINKTLLRRGAGIIPADSESFKNFESFILMAENGFITVELANQLAPSGSFRNVLAHEYDDIDPTQVYNALQKALTQYPQYVKAIQSYLDALEED
ncbi:DUF86 domain-containing protein (plasmid) [Kovacikia minuta CCNUW1]|uniref:type VII toxin-antitoxin system HepT family RNase toxin n=1 Tax=Kovacikia minuta TaxID=2931930 RepID=UPI001CCE5FF6|nr:DUF86 domain-containing protein [Kovacikia minuta]UBF30652.1 DUF86 domain-containing protein [Kovacikia minuta CCNUW1]